MEHYGTSKFAGPVAGATITLSSGDPTRCVSLSNTTLTTNVAGSATATADAAAARVTDCIAEITATYATAKNSPQVANITNKAP